MLGNIYYLIAFPKTHFYHNAFRTQYLSTVCLKYLWLLLQSHELVDVNALLEIGLPPLQKQCYQFSVSNLTVKIYSLSSYMYSLLNVWFYSLTSAAKMMINSKIFSALE